MTARVSDAARRRRAGTGGSRRRAGAAAIRAGADGLRTRPLRVGLSALGIAIGIAAMVAVVGISVSGRADLQRRLDRLGTNLLTVAGGDNAPGGENAEGGEQAAGGADDAPRFPADAVAMIERIGPVLDAAAISELPDDTHVYRNDHVPVQQTNGIVPYAVDLDLLAVVGAGLADGAWLNPAVASLPGVVLGVAAAQRLGSGGPVRASWCRSPTNASR